MINYQTRENHYIGLHRGTVGTHKKGAAFDAKFFAFLEELKKNLPSGV